MRINLKNGYQLLRFICVEKIGFMGAFKTVKWCTRASMSLLLGVLFSSLAIIPAKALESRNELSFYLLS
jgi:hypothetical protein